MMKTPEAITLKRNCEATQIPSGNKVTLYAGTELTLMQSLGGTYTVVTHQGLMASIDGKDADALGKEVAAGISQPQESAGGEKPVEEMVWAHLRTCYDPEIPHNIVDLGLIYDCQIAPRPQGDGDKVEIKMTLTAPGCGMGDWLKQDIQRKLLTIPGVKEANVNVVFDPPWHPNRMAPPLRRELNM